MTLDWRRRTHSSPRTYQVRENVVEMIKIRQNSGILTVEFLENIQWNFNRNRTEESVFFSEVSSFQRLKEWYSILYLDGKRCPF